MKTKKPEEPRKLEFSISWYCRSCWQEGRVTVQEEKPPYWWPDKPAECPEVRKDHAAIIRGFMGKAGKCAGDFHIQKRRLNPRVKREPNPLLPDSGEPITQTKGPTT